ncbi:OmpA family protein [Pseudomonas nitroreducens]|uniref:OmpA family protein n=1 Tax=Pseudomonas nitroreducens TaxID=46680 RepID=UPI00147CCE5C|nr:OmpA family protein [Pseudomonas nitroreducens]NNN23146.1 OmpA family protein [Pseudomonas nitroreducens]
MKKRADKHSEVIIKRRSKKGHDDEHGGAWKVAFADFTLAMMALFMVLWIVHPQTEPQPVAVGDQDANPVVDGGAGVFDGASRTPVELDGMPQPIKTPEKPAPQLALDAGKQGKAGEQAKDASTQQDGRQYDSNEDLRELAELIREVSGKVDALANIEVTVVPQGLRILIKDDQQRFMFARGQATLDPHFQTLLGALSGVLSKVQNKLILSGHTDAVQYRRPDGYNNWNLSGDRALRARNVMVDSGLPAAHVLQVAAQADVMPLRPEDPQSGANRRIEILLLTHRAESLYREIFGESYAQVHYSASGAKLVEPQPAQPEKTEAPASAAVEASTPAAAAKPALRL